MLIASSHEPSGDVVTAPRPTLPPPLNSNRWALLQPGHLSEQSDRSSETATEDMAPRPRYGVSAVARFTGLAEVALFMNGKMRGKKKSG